MTAQIILNHRHTIVYQYQDPARWLDGLALALALAVFGLALIVTLAALGSTIALGCYVALFPAVAGLSVSLAVFKNEVKRGAA